MSFNPDNYDLKKLSEYPEIEFGNDLPDAAFIPAVSIDENAALANYKIMLSKIRDFIIQTGDYTNVIDYRPTPYYSATGLQLTINGGWRLECPNGFLNTGEYQNENIEIAAARHIDLSNQGSGQWVLFLTADDTYIVRKSNLLVRKSRAAETAPETGTILYEVSTNTWWRYSGTDWNQLIGMPLINVEIVSGAMSVALTNSLMRNRLNLEYLLLQAGVEIPESRGPFERIISNVKKSGADLLYYIPAHTEVDLANYADTLNLIKTAHARGVALGVKSFTVNDVTYQFYHDDETGLDFALDLDTYANHYTNLGTAPFIYYDGNVTIWTPKVAHGQLIYENSYSQTASNFNLAMHLKIFADGWMSYTGHVTVTANGVDVPITFPFPFMDERYKTGNCFEYSKKEAAQYEFITARNKTVNGFSIEGFLTNSKGTSVSAEGFINESSFASIPNADTYNEYYLIGNAVKNIPADLAGQLATILNNYNQIVQQGADFFSIQATDDADALAKSQANPTKFVYVADS